MARSPEAAMDQRQLGILLDASAQLNRDLDIRQVMRNLVDAACRLLDARDGAAGIFVGGEMVFSEYRRDGQWLPVDFAFAAGEGVPGWVIVHREAYVSNDAANDPQVIQAIRTELGFHNLIDTPIVGRNGSLMGCFEIHNTAGRRPLGDRDVLLMQSLAGIAAVALENADLLDRHRLAEQQIRALNESLERRVAERTAELQGALRQLDAFSCSVSHDLRSPLRAINGFAHLLLERIGDRGDGGVRELLGRIVANTQRMGKLIDDLLQFSRAGQLAINAGPVDLGVLAREVVAELRGDYPDAQVSVADTPVVRGDRMLLRLVMENLLSNAFKFSGKREQAVIEVSGGPHEDGGVALQVRDNGTGFDMCYVERLFNVFERLHGDAEFPGTGVGLAIVRRVVERHGGRVWAEAAPGQGAVFGFLLPAAD